MTHAEAIRNNGALRPTDCPGELEVVDTFPDRISDGGQMVDRVVTLYRCRGCGWRVAMSGHLPLNHYPEVRPEEMRARLAMRLDGRDPRAQRTD